MGISDRFQAAVRAFKLGSAAFHAHEMVSGHNNDTYSPAEYGTYLTTSNAVFTCLKLRAEQLASFPPRGYFFDKDAKKKEVIAHESLKVLKKVNDFWTFNRLMRMTEFSLGIWGRAYWFIERKGPNRRGDPVEIWWARADRVKVYPDPKNYIKYFSYDPMDGGKPIFFEPQETIWFRYPNPMDEFGGLSPIAAARLAADTRSAAAKSNKKLFDQGLLSGGFLFPKNNIRFSPTQAEELEESIQKRFSGQDKAHRWGVLRFEAEMKANNVTPKDAEFLGTLEWGLEEVARAYGIPLDLIGGQRTYENVQSSERSLIYRTMLPEAQFIASELTEQYLPMFNRKKDPIDLIELDLSNLPVLQDAESEQWKREKEQIDAGALTINDWREGKGKDPYAWGDAWWVEFGKGPVTDETTDMLPANTEVVANQESYLNGTVRVKKKEDQNQKKNISTRKAVEYGSDEHQRLWKRFDRRVTAREDLIKRMLRDLWQRQQDSVLAGLRGWVDGSTRSEEDLDPFDLKDWIRRFREAYRPVLRKVVKEAGDDAISDLLLILDFDIDAPEVVRAMEKQTQKFAVEVNETTWDDLKAALAEGKEAGEGTDKLIARIKEFFLIYIGTDPAVGEKLSRLEMIARTESVNASNAGTLEAWRQSGVVNGKGWLSALIPGRTRGSHADAHDRYQENPIPLDEDFLVGGGSGPHPGAIGLPEEDINCLCTMTAEVVEE